MATVPPASKHAKASGFANATLLLPALALPYIGIGLLFPAIGVFFATYWAGDFDVCS